MSFTNSYPKMRLLWLLLLLLLNFSSIECLPIEQESIRWVDDMKLTVEQLNYLEGNVKARNVQLWPGYYWPHGELVFSIGSGLDAADSSHIRQAMLAISKLTCIRFRETPNSQEPQVVIERKDAGCWSFVGYLGRQQSLNLGPGCMSPGIIQHELLHALAFLHMQSDPNRDMFVRIDFDNIQSGMEYNFAINKPQSVGDLGVGYDYNSIMHYGAYAFSKNGRPTIIPLQANARIGQRNGLSSKDIIKLQKIYCSSK